MSAVTRSRSEPIAAVGHDSFLDVVTNMVGILIVLVLVVGLRIRNTPVVIQPSPETQQAAEMLQQDQATERALHHDLIQTEAAIDALGQQTSVRRHQRDLLATLAAALENKLHHARQQLDTATRLRFDLKRKIAETEATLKKLEADRAELEALAAQPELVTTYATPLAQAVLEEEIHFHLRGGRIAHVPLEKLLLAARDDARRKADKVFESNGLPEFTETVGPENGFRLRYTAERYEKTEATPNGPVRYRGLRISEWTIIPVSAQLGETTDEALAPQSQFRRVLQELRPGRTTATIWVYADSFGSFRRLRDELHRLGLRVAARPLPEGMMIAGSPRGSRSESE